MRKRDKRKIFFGWFTVFATNILTMWSSVKSYSFGVYFKPLMSEFGWTRAQASIASSLGVLEGGIEGPIGGMATDKYGPRAVSMAGILLSSFGLFLMYFVNSLWGFIIVWGLIVSTGFNLGYMQPMNTAITRWFVKKRGLALSIARVGSALGGTIIPPLMTYLLYTWGWREAFAISGVLTLVIGLPLVWFFVKPQRPEFYGLLPDGEDPSKDQDTKLLIKAGAEYATKFNEYEFSLRQAMKTTSFWWICISFIFRNLSWPIIQVHLIPYLTDIGFDPMGAATALAIMTAISAPFRIVGGFIADKIAINKFRYALIGTLILQDIIAWYLLLFPSNMMDVYIALIIRGVALGTRTGLEYPMQAKYYGRKAFSSIDGIFTMFRLPGNIIVPIYAGWVFDTTGGYQGAFWTIALCTIIAISTLFLAKPPKPPTKITDVTEFL